MPVVVRDVDETNFDAEVIKNSGLVIILFHAKWCTASRRLIPLINKLAQALSGKAKVVTMDADVSGGFGSRVYGLRSVPTILYFHKGQIVERIKADYRYQGERKIERVPNYLGGIAKYREFAETHLAVQN